MVVFVPLSGLASVNQDFLDLMVTAKIQVFVPLSGLASVNENPKVSKQLNLEEFSSPYRG